MSLLSRINLSRKNVIVFPDLLETKYIELDNEKTDLDTIHIKNFGSIKANFQPFAFLEAYDSFEETLQNEVVPYIKKRLDLNFLDNITLVIPSLYNVFNWITIPMKANIDIPKSLLAKMEPLLPHHINEWIISFNNYLNTDKNNILTTSILKGAVIGAKRAFKKRGLKLRHIQPADFSLERILSKYNKGEYDNEEQKYKNICVINMEDESTNISLCQNGLVKLIRIINVGEEKLIKTLMSQLNYTWNESKKVLFNKKIFLKDHPEEQNQVRTYNILRPILGELIKETYNACDGYLARFKEFKIHEIIFCGNASNIMNFGNYIQSNLNIPVKHLSDIITVKKNNKDLEENIINSFACALGACYTSKLDYLGNNITFLKEDSEFKKKAKSIFERIKHEFSGKSGYIIIQRTGNNYSFYLCKKYKLINNGRFVKLFNIIDPIVLPEDIINEREVSNILPIRNFKEIKGNIKPYLHDKGMYFNV